MINGLFVYKVNKNTQKYTKTKEGKRNGIIRVNTYKNIIKYERGITLTKKELEQLNDLKAEIQELEKKIIELSQKKIDVAKDVVNASGNSFPYTQGHVTISGYDVAADKRKIQTIDNKIELLRKRQQKAEKLEREILEFINSVEDSKIRRILQYRYIDGYKWSKISRIMQCDESYPDKLIIAYLNRFNK